MVPAESFGAALQYFTGSKEHNVVLRGLAKSRGLKINEYGVFQVTPEGEKYVAGRTEEEVYGTLGLPAFPPEIREARFEFAWAAAGPLPRLVEIADLQGRSAHAHHGDRWPSNAWPKWSPPRERMVSLTLPSPIIPNG